MIQLTPSTSQDNNPAITRLTGAGDMTSEALPTPFPLLTETEAGILGLYDQLQQLQLELALLRSQQSHHASGQSPLTLG